MALLPCCNPLARRVRGDKNPMQWLNFRRRKFDQLLNRAFLLNNMLRHTVRRFIGTLVYGELAADSSKLLDSTLSALTAATKIGMSCCCPDRSVCATTISIYAFTG